MTTIRYGLIGCGMMGQEHIANLQLTGQGSVQAFFEPDDAMAAKASAMVPDAVRANDLDGMLARGDLDALLVVSPNDCHADQFAQIAQTNPLPLLIEKPLFTDPEDGARIRALAGRYPAPIWVAMEYRYMPPITSLIAQVEAATGGVRMLTIREHRFPFLPKIGGWNRHNARTGGTLVEKCCHFFDLMRLIVRAEPVRVMASGAQDVNFGDECDVWDNAYVIVDFDNGARAMLELCMFAEGAEYQEEVTAVGPSGKIEAKVPGPGRFWPEDLGEAPEPQVIISPRAPKGPWKQAVPVDPTLLHAGDHNGSTFYQHQKFQRAVLGAGPVEVSVTDGAIAVEMGLAAQESARLGQAVTIAAQPVQVAPLVHSGAH